MPLNLRTPVIISLASVLPFVILELINRRSFPEGFPVVLFGAMWVLTLVFILLLRPIVESLRAGNPPKPLTLLPKVVLLTVIASFWVGLIIDQMPCFLGVPNCD